MTLEDSIKSNPYLGRYLQQFERETGIVPDFYEHLSLDMRYLRRPNILYPVGDPIFIHVYKPEEAALYNVVEPTLDAQELKKYGEIKGLIFSKVPYVKPYETKDEFISSLDRLYRDSIAIGPQPLLSIKRRVPIKRDQYADIGYQLGRDVIAYGRLEGILRDPYIEDIHGIGTQRLFVHHKIFGLIETNVQFGTDFELNDYLKRLSERCGRPVSDARPIIDAALPEGERINIIYSEDVSQKGASFTIRKFSEEPISFTQLVKWNTIDAREAAYLWICLENDMSVFMCGETAAGKTTTLNALLSLVPLDSKLYSVEQTPEIRAPQAAWQQLITREAGPMESRVEMFDLLKAALRSRPHYVIVGEIRGPEGAITFQAMQTGHPVLSTFHSSSVAKMIQRLTGDPINVPVRYIDNLNVALFQQMVYVGGNNERRCTAITEVLGYSATQGGVMTRNVFAWRPDTDTHDFLGSYNSFVLEGKIAPRLGYDDPTLVYRDLEERTKIVQKMVDHNIFRRNEVDQVVDAYAKGGAGALPFSI